MSHTDSVTAETNGASALKSDALHRDRPHVFLDWEQCRDFNNSLVIKDDRDAAGRGIQGYAFSDHEHVWVIDLMSATVDQFDGEWPERQTTLNGLHRLVECLYLHNYCYSQ